MISLLVVAGVLVTACIPLAFPYIRPVAVEGKLIRTMCVYPPPKSTLQVKVSGMELQFHSESMSLVTVIVPEGVKVAFTRRVFVSRSSASDSRREHAISEIHYYERDPFREGRLDASDPMIGASHKGWFNTVLERRFYVHADVSAEDLKGRFVQLPDLLINGQQVHLPEVEFIRKWWFALVPVNC